MSGVDEEASELRKRLQQETAKSLRLENCLRSVRAAICASAADTLWVPGASNMTIVEMIDAEVGEGSPK